MKKAVFTYKNDHLYPKNEAAKELMIIIGLQSVNLYNLRGAHEHAKKWGYEIETDKKQKFQFLNKNRYRLINSEQEY